MYNFLFLISLNIFLFFITNLILNKYKLFLDDVESSPHKNFVSKKKIPYSGGLIFILSIIFFGYYKSYFNILIIFSLFLIGLLSDTNKLSSVSKRFLLQILIIIFFIFVNNSFIPEIKIIFFDNLLNKYKIISYIFTSFCLLILLNGSNFIDGVNIQCSGYYFAIICALLLLPKSLFNLDLYNQLLIIFAFLLVFIFFNFFDQCYLGDSGSYLVSFLVGTLLIKVINENPISPYFIALLLWYPAFENLFSIIRRLVFNKKSIDNADNQHLHHLLYRSFKNKSNLFKKNITGVMINLYNFIIFLIGINYLYDSYVQVILILISIIFYSLTYKILKNNLSNEIR